MSKAKPPLSKQDAIALTRGKYADVVEKAIAVSIAPLVWFPPDAEDSLKARNGTAFFVSADRTFAVTADHVFAEYLKARKAFGKRVTCQLGNLRFDPENRLIARDAHLDIATFLISQDEIRETSAGKSAMSFEPMVPQAGKGVVFVGFPGHERHHLSERKIETGIFTALTVAENVTNLQISGHFDRRYQVDMPGRPSAPTGYDLGGVSGRLL